MKSGNASRDWTLAFPAMFVAMFVAVFSALLTGCFSGDDPAGTSTGTNTGTTTGMVLLADGKPAKGATVKVFPVGYRPAQDTLASASFRTETDDRGRYHVGSLPTGEYNILGSLDGRAAFEDSVFISSQPKALDTLFLDDPGTVSGYVALEPGDPLPTVIVQALGTQAFANVSAAGFFRLPALAAGVYRLAVSTTLPDYTPFYGDIEVRAGMKDTLADTLRPIFTGIPQVTGLRAAYDTLDGIVHLSWNASGHSNLGGYLLYRDTVGAVRRTTASFAEVRDTTADDTLWKLSGRRPDEDALVKRYEYRVAILDGFGNPGRTLKFLPVTAPSPAHALTFQSLRADGLQAGSASLGDTVRIIRSFRNRTRDIRKVEWETQATAGTGHQIRVSGLDSAAGQDTLFFACGGEAGTVLVISKVIDEGGQAYEERFSFSVVSDPPKVSLSGDALVSLKDSIRLSSAAMDGFGRIVKWEWDLSGSGQFVPGSKDTMYQAPGTPKQALAAVVRVTDDDGQTGLDTFHIEVVNDPPTVSLSGSSQVRLGEAISLSAPASDRFGRIVKWEWDFGGKNEFVAGPKDTVFTAPSGPPGPLPVVVRVTDDDGQTGLDTLSVLIVPWRKGKPMPFELRNASVAGLNGKAYLIGGQVLVGGVWELTDKGLVYDPATDTWTELPPMSRPKMYARVVSIGTRIYAVGGQVSTGYLRYGYVSDVEEFDPASGAWTRRSDTPRLGVEFQAAAVQGKIHLIGGQWAGNNSLGYRQALIYDPAADSWTESPVIINSSSGDPAAFYGQLAVAGLGPDMYVLSHRNNADYDFKLLSQANWRVNPQPSFRLHPEYWNPTAAHPQFVQLGGRLYVAGGAQVYGSQSIQNTLIAQVQTFDPAANAWSVWHPFPHNRHVDYLAASDGRLIAIGASVEGRNGVVDPRLVEWAEVE